jgi:hypothetical protein
MNPLLTPLDVKSINAINHWYDTAIESGQNAVSAAVECGKLLVIEKEDCDHGEWLEWLQINFKGTPRTAQRFMRLANASASVALTGETLTDALASISTPKPPKPAVKHDAVILPRPDARKDRPAPATASRFADSVVIDAEIVQPRSPSSIERATRGTLDMFRNPAPAPAPQDDEPLTEKESAWLAELEAIIENGISEHPEMFKDSTADIETLVVDGVKNEPPESCWTMAWNFIETLKPLRAWEERHALCDVRDACNRRLHELDKLNGKEKPNISPSTK